MRGTIIRGCQVLPSLPRSPCWRIQRNLQPEADVARRLRLAAIAHTYSILPYLSVIVACLLVYSYMCNNYTQAPKLDAPDLISTPVGRVTPLSLSLCVCVCLSHSRRRSVEIRVSDRNRLRTQRAEQNLQTHFPIIHDLNHCCVTSLGLARIGSVCPSSFCLGIDSPFE